MDLFPFPSCSDSSCSGTGSAQHWSHQGHSPPWCHSYPHGWSWTCGPWMSVQVLVAIEVDISEPVAIAGNLLATRWNPSHASPLQDALPAAPLGNLQATQGSSCVGFILGCCYGTDW